MSPVTPEKHIEIKTKQWQGSTIVSHKVKDVSPELQSRIRDYVKEYGISDSDYVYVDYIFTHESGWNPDAKNPHSSAEGLPQALPYSKTGCDHGDAKCQIAWSDTYAKASYGSWQGAYNHWRSHGWW